MFWMKQNLGFTKHPGARLSLGCGICHNPTVYCDLGILVTDPPHCFLLSISQKNRWFLLPFFLFHHSFYFTQLIRPRQSATEPFQKTVTQRFQVTPSRWS